MNTLSKKRALCNLLLLSALLSPVMSMAQEQGGQQSGQGGQGQSGDITNTEMVTALINYLAKESIQRYGYEEQKLFQVAPGSLWASKAGGEAGAMNFEKLALDIMNRSMINSLAPLSSQKQITVGEVTVDSETAPASGALELYRSMSGFFTEGDTTNLKSINAGALLQATNLTDAGYTPEESQNLVNMLVNPFPAQNPDITAKLRSGTKLDGSQMEELGGMLAQYAAFGVSANAWADIVARRTPAATSSDTTGTDTTTGTIDNKTAMQIMKDTSEKRFTSKEWYAAIGTASETALLREIAQMMAYNQWVQYQQFRMAEQQVSLLASLNAIMAKMNRSIDKMNTEMSKAQAEATLQGDRASRELQEQKDAADQQAKDAQESSGQ